MMWKVGRPVFDDVDDLIFTDAELGAAASGEKESSSMESHAAGVDFSFSPCA